MEEYEKQALAERHLISPQMIDGSVHRALLLSQDNRISIMINEEDHLRIQCMAPGLIWIPALQPRIRWMTVWRVRLIRV